MTEFGSMALVDEGQGDHDGKSLSLPGVVKGDMSSRHWRPEVHVSGVHFSPTGKLSLGVSASCSKKQFCCPTSARKMNYKTPLWTTGAVISRVRDCNVMLPLVQVSSEMNLTLCHERD